MPHIRWNSLPFAVREHMYARLRERGLTPADMAALAAWIATNPNVPEGEWCKDFGSFKVVGLGPVPKTFLTENQPCYGVRL